jgi:hypothetical protein
MVVRNRARSDRLQDVIDRLPERFLSASVTVEGGAMVGLRDYMADLGNHLRVALGTDQPPVVDVMRSIGIEPSAWYRAAFEAGAGSQIVSGQWLANAAREAHAQIADAATRRPHLRVVQEDVT